MTTNYSHLFSIHRFQNFNFRVCHEIFNLLFAQHSWWIFRHRFLDGIGLQEAAPGFHITGMIEVSSVVRIENCARHLSLKFFYPLRRLVLDQIAIVQQRLVKKHLPQEHVNGLEPTTYILTTHFELNKHCVDAEIRESDGRTNEVHLIRWKLQVTEAHKAYAEQYNVPDSHHCENGHEDA